MSDCFIFAAMNLKSFVQNNNTVRFDFYRAGNLYYIVKDTDGGNSFRFPVPTSDVGDASFLSEDKAILFMRYIRKSIEEKTLEEVEHLKVR